MMNNESNHTPDHPCGESGTPAAVPEVQTVAEKGHRSFRIFTVVLIFFLIAQGAFVAYAHWFVTRGVGSAMDDLSDSGLVGELRALVESSLGDLDDLGGLEIGPEQTPGTAPDTNTETPSPESAPKRVPQSPRSPLLDPRAEISMDELMGIAEALGRALEKELGGPDGRDARPEARPDQRENDTREQPEEKTYDIRHDRQERAALQPVPRPVTDNATG